MALQTESGNPEHNSGYTDYRCALRKRDIPSDVWILSLIAKLLHGHRYWLPPCIS